MPVIPNTDMSSVNRVYLVAWVCPKAYFFYLCSQFLDMCDYNWIQQYCFWDVATWFYNLEGVQSSKIMIQTFPSCFRARVPSGTGAEQRFFKRFLIMTNWTGYFLFPCHVPERRSDDHSGDHDSCNTLCGHQQYRITKRGSDANTHVLLVTIVLNKH